MDGVRMAAGIGSSPRMRGAPPPACVKSGCAGIIPAYAGSTLPLQIWAVRSWDHPRVCGEHGGWAGTSRSSRGSSPRMRGARVSVFHVQAKNRDHPRVCGEHSRPPVASRSGSGSSPRMRGAQRGKLCKHVLCGIIPAYAGSTRPAPSACSRRGDHPRVCGEHWRGIRCRR